MELRQLINWFLPGGTLFLLLGLCVGVALLWAGDRLRRVGRIVLTAVAAFHLVASTKVGADLLLAPLYRHDGFLTDRAAAHGATAVVLLNPGASTYRARGAQVTSVGHEGSLRALEAARVYRLLGDPVVIVAGGYPEHTDRPSFGEILKRTLTELGVPAHRIVIEPDSRNTWEHVRNLRPYLEQHGVKRFVLVTSPIHMWRSSSAFRRAGYDFVTSAASAHSEIADEPAGLSWLPQHEHLDRVLRGTHEYIGLAVYWWYDYI